MPRFGVHNSIAGGLPNALAIGVRLKCDCMQMFVRNQRQWRSPSLTDEQVANWLAARTATRIAPVVAHANYLLNLASPAPAVWRRSYAAFLDEFDRCDRLGVEFIVIHPGSHLGAGLPGGIARLADAMNRLLADRPDARTVVLLETTAGQGNGVGRRFEELAEVFGRVGPAADAPATGWKPVPPAARLGVCLDTCHVFAAGYDVRTPEAVARTLDEFDTVIGLSRLRVVHVNDSKRELASRVDRHAHVGLGHIGDAGFWSLLHDGRIIARPDLPMILETPKEFDPATGREWDKLNLARLRRLARRDRCPK